MKAKNIKPGPRNALLAILLTIFTMVSSAFSQTTNEPPTWVGSPIFDMLGKSNLVAGTFVTFDDTDNTWGGGVFLGYKLTEMIVPIFRVDYVRDDAYAVSGNVQLQLPVDIGKSLTHPEGVIRLTPLTFAGIATSWNNNDNSNDGSVIGIFGFGLALTVKADHSWWVPSGVVADWERWTGSGFNDSMVRFGPFWKF